MAKSPFYIVSNYRTQCTLMPLPSGPEQCHRVKNVILACLDAVDHVHLNHHGFPTLLWGQGSIETINEPKCKQPGEMLFIVLSCLL